MGLVTQQDPIGIAGGLNLYGYANGDPVNFSDPFGLSPCPSTFWCVLQNMIRRVMGSAGTTPERAVAGVERTIDVGTDLGLCVASGGLTVTSAVADATLVAGSSAGGLALGSGARGALRTIARESATPGLSSAGARELRAAGRRMAEGAADIGSETATSVASRTRTAPMSGAVTLGSGGDLGPALADAAISAAPFFGTAAGIGQTADICGSIGR